MYFIKRIRTSKSWFPTHH